MGCSQKYVPLLVIDPIATPNMYGHQNWTLISGTTQLLSSHRRQGISTGAFELQQTRVGGFRISGLGLKVLIKMYVSRKLFFSLSARGARYLCLGSVGPASMRQCFHVTGTNAFVDHCKNCSLKP